MERTIDISSKRVLYWAAGLSVAAGLVHGIAAPEHLSEWWGYGVFFILAAMAQPLYGILLLLQPWRYDNRGDIRSDADRYARRYCLLGLTGNAAVIILYIITRTVGIPFLGPEAGEVEPVTAISLMSKTLEIALIVCLWLLIRRIPTKVPRS
jgi:hypothetical protein